MKDSYIINYRDKLDNFREYLRDNDSENCIDTLQRLVEESKPRLSGLMNSQKEPLEDVFIRTLSKDLSRYYDSFKRFHNALSKMDKDKDLIYLRRKIILGDKNFFKDTWKEDSDNFYRTRKFISDYLEKGDLSLSHKLCASLDCMVTGLHRYTLSRFGKLWYGKLL